MKVYHRVSFLVVSLVATLALSGSPLKAAVTNENVLPSDVNTEMHQTAPAEHFDIKIESDAPVRTDFVDPSLSTDKTVIMDKSANVSDKTLVDLASQKPELSTFVDLVKAADLNVVLEGKGPFTIFAPNNAAFAKLSPGTLEDLKKPENIDKLRSILNFHIVSGEFSTAEASTQHLQSMNGQEIAFVVTGQRGMGSTIMVNDAKVVGIDLVNNGEIFVIDTVLMPQ